MTKDENIRLIELAGKLEEIRDNLYRIGETIDVRVTQELVNKELALVDDVIYEVLAVGAGIENRLYVFDKISHKVYYIYSAVNLIESQQKAL